MKSILLLVNDIHFKGGGERVASNFATYYAERGYPVTILSMDIKKTNTLYPVHQNVKIDYLSVPHTRFISKIRVFHKFRTYLKKHFFYYSLGIGTYSNIILGFTLKKGCGLFIGCEHNTLGCISIFWKYLSKLAYPRLNALIVLTQADLLAAKRIHRYSYVIPNSISTSNQSSALVNKKILAVGKLYYQKGFDIMLNIFAEFSKYNYDWNLTIVGDGELKSDLYSLINKLGLKNRVEITPQTDMINDHYLDSSIYLMTSRFEGFPMVLLEAQAFGIPVIAYDCKTGPSEIIEHNKSGFIVPFGDKSKMVEALKLLCSDDKLRLDMGQNAKQNVKRFSPEIVYKMWDELFEKL